MNDMDQCDISISIVSYNSAHVLLNCLSSIIKGIEKHTFELIVVDNASSDKTCALVRGHFPQVTLLENSLNAGFGRAHNQAFRISRGKLFLVLNPDTVLSPGAVDKIASFMESHADAGAAGCKIWWDDNKNFMFPDIRIHSLITALFQFTPFCRYFPNSAISRWYWKSAYRLWNATEPIEVEGITGGLILLRREAFEEIGMFDENFFLFFEEHDLLKRIKKAGWKIFYLPNAEIQHFFEESVRSAPLDIGKIYRTSALYYYRKHYGLFGYIFMKMLFSLNRIIPFLETYLSKLAVPYKEIHPSDGLINLEWHTDKEANEYLVEISYSPTFADRGGMYVKSRQINFSKDILNRLPNKTGFIKIIPIYTNRIGKAKDFFAIREAS
ncbi:MAG: glycosyltransferase family 2 protein [Nitrospirae bacterium]|nr:glycosyltransferase family 2 protein [Nitrospirota bacterium]